MRALLLLVSLALLPHAARAHLVESGFGDFYDGALHLAVTPGDLLVVIGMALLTGMQGPVAARAALASLVTGWAAGALISVILPTVSLDRIAVIAFGALGVLVLLDRRVSRTVVVAIAIAVGIAQGLGAALSVRGQTAGWVWLAGSLTSLIVVATLLAALIVALRAPWTRIAVRAVGSWLVAASVLMLGWALRATL